MQILYWQIAPLLKKEVEKNYRTNFALSLKNEDSLTIMRRLTFDDTAPTVTIANIENLFSYLEANFLKKKMAGIGVEIGAGPAVFSSILAKRPTIERMYAVEVCKSVVENLAVKVVSQIADINSNKVVACVGEFDNLEIADNSANFIFDFFSLHHSKNPAVTLKECCRVLKPGGFVLALDKARSDHCTSADLEKMLDTEYDGSFKKQIGFPPEKKLTRRENGEGEYRLKDWRQFFLNSGFGEFEHYRLDQTSGGSFTAVLAKTALSFLPAKLQPLLTQFYPKRNSLFELSWQNRIFCPQINSFRKEISLMIAYKQSV